MLRFSISNELSRRPRLMTQIPGPPYMTTLCFRCTSTASPHFIIAEPSGAGVLITGLIVDKLLRLGDSSYGKVVGGVHGKKKVSYRRARLILSPNL
jgi:hypothetical protein